MDIVDYRKTNRDSLIIFGFIILNCFLTLFHQIIYHYVPSSDSLRYIELANQYSEFNFFDPVSNCYGHSFYAFFLLIFSGVFSYSHFVIGVLQSILFSVATFLLVSELEKTIQRKLKVVLLLVAFIPDVYFYNGYVLTESLSISMIIFLFYLALRIYNNKTASVRSVLVLAIVLVCNILNRIETAAVLLPLLYLINPVIKPRFVFYTLGILGIVFLSLQWNGYRNYRIYGIYKLSAFNGGEVVYAGNNENLDGSHHVFWQSPYKEIFLPKEKWALIDSINELPPEISFPRRDSLFFSMAKDAWKKDPIAQLGVIPNKLAKNWLLPGMFDIYTGDTSKATGLQIKKHLSKEYFNNTWYAPYKHLFYMLIHLAILSVIIIGMLQREKTNRFQTAMLCLFFLWLLFAIPFCGLPRWHVAIFPLLFISFVPPFIIDKVTVFINKSIHFMGVR